MSITPGPWVYENGEVLTLADEVQYQCTSKELERVTGDFCHNRAICHLDDGEHIVYVKDTEKVSNGYLMAAAPELLDAAKEARDALYVAILANWEGATHEDIPKHVVIQKLDSAITKALTGGGNNGR